jgi:fumarylacetoacetase
MLDITHDPNRRSWISSAHGHSDFPIQNLPLCIFSTAGGKRGGGVAIGDQILDLAALAASGLLHGHAAAAGNAAAGPTLNAFLALGAAARGDLRLQLSNLLATDAPADIKDKLTPMLVAASACEFHVPVEVGDFTDFFAGIHHAVKAGKMFRPDNPLLPNYKYVPVGYHSRGSSIRVSGHPVVRPNGQHMLSGQQSPVFGPCKNLDYELELSIWVGRESRLGEPVPIEQAGDYIAGMSLLNDWSARDIQRWEYQPLGPFLAKNFLTTVAPFVVTIEALAPYRRPQPARPAGDPAPLPYLFASADQDQGAFDIQVEAYLLTERMRAAGAPPHRLSHATALDLYWTPAQLLAHHTCNGCNLQVGDMLGTGTISGEPVEESGSLLELSVGGRQLLSLPSGEQRGFLQDGDEVIFRAYCEGPGAVRIGFGEARGRIMPAPSL